jgi:nitroreductase
MEKPAQADNPIHPLIEKRWSPRAFSNKRIDSDTLRSILEAARWAPSSYNEQPWSFIVATKDDPAEYERLLSCLVPGNQEWAQQAPVLMLSVARMSFERNANPNRHAFHDVGLAVANLILQAMSMDIYAHPMGGFDRDKARETYNIPEGYEPVAGIALGYAGNPQTLPDHYRETELAPRERKPLDSFVYSGRWGEVSPVVGG